jgi:integrase
MAENKPILLTDAAVRKLRPDPKRVRVIRDLGARSLYFVIAPSGHKSWMMRFRRPGGKPGKIVLGPLDLSGRELEGVPQIGQPLSLAAARALAAAVHRDRALGRDPVADHKARRHRQKAELEERGANTFANAARQFIEEHAVPKTRRWPETARLLGLQPEDLSPILGGLAIRWGDRPVRDIDSHDIWSAIDEARRIGVPGRAVRNPALSDARGRALFAALSSMFGWLQRHRRVEGNPCANIHRPAGAKMRERALSNDEIRWFWLACDAADAPRAPGAPPLFAPLLRLLLLTGARLNEIARMTYDELHDDVWRLAGTRTKNRKAHQVPLPPLARELIASTRAKPGVAGFVFTTTGRTPVSGWGRVKDRLDKAMLAVAQKERGLDATIEPWRLHDLRRTFVTGLAELGIPIDVIELAVNHISGTRAAVAGVYNRSELLPERRSALEHWAAHIERLISGDTAAKILPLHGSRR